ncbi:hypothetical protein ACIBW9_35405 [Streptomyces sp. NPDC049541]|uniref:hypothetical protein n=1 Tax=Streptomyces sp. NPDC049541 TaxID=3365594 RepID=UPI0037B335B4
MLQGSCDDEPSQALGLHVGCDGDSADAYPLPRITDLEELVPALAALLPTLTALASSPPDGSPELLT